MTHVLSWIERCQPLPRAGALLPHWGRWVSRLLSFRAQASRLRSRPACRRSGMEGIRAVRRTGRRAAVSLTVPDPQPEARRPPFPGSQSRHRKAPIKRSGGRLAPGCWDRESGRRENRRSRIACPMGRGGVRIVPFLKNRPIPAKSGALPVISSVFALFHSCQAKPLVVFFPILGQAATRYSVFLEGPVRFSTFSTEFSTNRLRNRPEEVGGPQYGPMQEPQRAGASGDSHAGRIQRADAHGVSRLCGRRSKRRR